MPGVGRTSATWFLGWVIAGLAVSASSARAQSEPDAALAAVVAEMSRNEAAAIQHEPKYMFLQEERSDRTNQHLWLEAVAETDHGPLRRLLAEDGSPLSPERQRQVDDHVETLVNNPAMLDAENKSRFQDQQRGERMLSFPPNMFLYTAGARSGNTMHVDFKPNPAYIAPTYESRVLAAMEGEFVMDTKAVRLLSIDSKLSAPVKFGYGILGTIQSGELHLTRAETSHGDFKPEKLDLKVDGHLLLFRTVGRKQHFVRRNFELLPAAEPLPDVARRLLDFTRE